MKVFLIVYLVYLSTLSMAQAEEKYCENAVNRTSFLIYPLDPGGVASYEGVKGYGAHCEGPQKEREKFCSFINGDSPGAYVSKGTVGKDIVFEYAVNKSIDTLNHLRVTGILTPKDADGNSTFTVKMTGLAGGIDAYTQQITYNLRDDCKPVSISTRDRRNVISEKVCARLRPFIQSGASSLDASLLKKIDAECGSQLSPRMAYMEVDSYLKEDLHFCKPENKNWVDRLIHSPTVADVAFDSNRERDEGCKLLQQGWATKDGRHFSKLVGFGDGDSHGNEGNDWKKIYHSCRMLADGKFFAEPRVEGQAGPGRKTNLAR